MDNNMVTQLDFILTLLIFTLKCTPYLYLKKKNLNLVFSTVYESHAHTIPSKRHIIVSG
jgi:hypothetical protein